MNDGEFERMLVQSARGDAPPEDARDAWVRFSGTLGAMGSRPMPVDNPSGGSPTVAPGPSLLGSAARTAAMRWLLLGAMGGSAATAAVMLRIRPEATRAHAAVVVQEPMAPASVAGTPALPSRTIAAAPRSTLAAHPRHTGRSHARARQDAILPEGSDSTLAAEVSRIDAARTANAAGDYDEALWLIARYHRDFPDGALAPDADVVALEAVAAKRDRPEAARRAALFLSRYPDDPHTEKVKWLAEHLGSEQR